ncbi:MAG: TIGR00730 family Rossman fold protein [Planctomycetota bacterium]
MPLVCVYASSSQKLEASLYESVENIGHGAACAGWELIFGGARIGLMDSVAKGFQRGGGRVTAVIPKVFDRRELAYAAAEETIVTSDLRERKKIMQERADAFLVLPGGPGTLDEFFETLTLVQIRVMNKPILLWNRREHFRGTLDQIRLMSERGYAHGPLEDHFDVRVTAEEVVAQLAHYAPATPKNPG